ncbi:serine hydrolase [Aerosakkonema funiforme]|uniref:Serine hydrolase n=2 Tax=Oscillatoriophycideae TaxID=1301283 RepID=A0A926ZJL7_9CYAN|nr:serine hydrolase [Aerosakkonema funiforme]MBD2184522.1 serine hydrolase [Aerosakkonema funiforme FACHB-1375]
MPYQLAGQSLAILISIMGVTPPPAALASYAIFVSSTKEVVSPIHIQPCAIAKSLPYLAYKTKNNNSNKKAVIKFSSSKNLAKIASDSGLNSARITVCEISGKCWSYQGDRPPQSAASLIKVPIAIALLQKLSQNNMSLDRTIYVDTSNFTEEDYSPIKAGKSYTFRYLLTEMIARSSNIATNQIIDYLGWNYLNQVLDNLGYPTTQVGYKLTGESTKPTKNRGFGANRVTSNELSAMMMQIYNCEYPEYNVLIDIFNQQVDRELGFDALKTSAGNWLGEKTGENSKVRGATLAAKIKGKTYIITVTEDNGKSAPKIRDCIGKIVNYIAKNGTI